MSLFPLLSISCIFSCYPDFLGLFQTPSPAPLGFVKASPHTYWRVKKQRQEGSCGATLKVKCKNRGLSKTMRLSATQGGTHWGAGFRRSSRGSQMLRETPWGGMKESCPPWPGLQISLCKSNVLPWQAAHPFSFVWNRNGYRERGNPEIGTSHLIIKKSHQPAESIYCLLICSKKKKKEKSFFYFVFGSLFLKIPMLKT